MTDPRRALPSVSSLLDARGIAGLLAHAPRTLVVAAIRDVLDRARADAASAPAAADEWAAEVRRALDAIRQASLRPVLNATGVVLHTNLGRAPLAKTAIAAVARVAAGYSNLELDLESGERGSRYAHCAGLLRELTGAEDALVVNNNAAAVVLALNTVSDGRGCVVSRGELVEIGGSFRVPEIMRRSGARLIEVGTTNRTHLADYAGAIGAGVAAIIKVHRSNFAMEGFVADVDASDLATLGRERGVTVLHDLGSGLILPLDAHGLAGEPTARDAIGGGVDIVTMSGDKLLGGPQAGIILGRRATIDAIRTNPLTRAFRVDKMTLAALEATLDLYRDPERARREIPVLAQLTMSVADVRARAVAVRDSLAAGDRVEVIDTDASVGGGAYPTARIPSAGLAIAGDATAMERKLRTGEYPVIARVREGRVIVDLRTVLPDEDDWLLQSLRAVLSP